MSAKQTMYDFMAQLNKLDWERYQPDKPNRTISRMRVWEQIRDLANQEVSRLAELQSDFGDSIPFPRDPRCPVIAAIDRKP